MAKQTPLIICILLMLVLAAGTQAGEDGDFVINTSFVLSAPGKLDPAVITSLDELEVTSLLCEGLYTFEADPMETIPQLAADWSLLEDGLTYQFFLREGATFADGETPLTPSSVQFTFERLLSNFASIDPQGDIFVKNPGGAVVGHQLKSIQNAELELNSSALYLASLIAAVEAVPDTNQVQFVLRDPIDAEVFFRALALPAGFIVPETGDDYSQNPGCVGSYILDNSLGSDPLALVKNQNYYGLKPLSGTVNFITSYGEASLLDPEVRLQAYIEGVINVAPFGEGQLAEPPDVPDQELISIPSFDAFQEANPNLNEQELEVFKDVYPGPQDVYVTAEAFPNLQQPSPDDSFHWRCRFSRKC